MAQRKMRPSGRIFFRLSIRLISGAAGAGAGTAAAPDDAVATGLSCCRATSSGGGLCSSSPGGFEGGSEQVSAARFHRQVGSVCVGCGCGGGGRLLLGRGRRERDTHMQGVGTTWLPQEGGATQRHEAPLGPRCDWQAPARRLRPAAAAAQGSIAVN